jgi:hypothetical protein
MGKNGRAAVMLCRMAPVDMAAPAWCGQATFVMQGLD